MSKTALVLFGHGARDPQWATTMRRVAASVLVRAPEMRVEMAFLEFIEPDLAQCSEVLITQGFERIVVVPMFIAQGGHLKKDLPELLNALRQAHPAVNFELAAAVGEADSVVQAMAAHVAALGSL